MADSLTVNGGSSPLTVFNSSVAWETLSGLKLVSKRYAPLMHILCWNGRKVDREEQLCYTVLVGSIPTQHYSLVKAKINERPLHTDRKR